jgi:hypothetical protein
MYYVVGKQLCFVCYRIADKSTPRVPSVLGPCAACDAPIWISKKSPIAPPKICCHCTALDGLPEREKSA